MVKAVSFDVWGTLLDLDRTLRETSRVIAGELGQPFDGVYQRVLEAHEEARRMRRRALIPGNETVKAGQEILARKLGVEVREVEGLIHRAFLKVDPREITYSDVPGTLEELSRRGLRIAVAGNVLFWPSSYTWMLLEKGGLTRFVEVKLFSDETGFNKPDRGFFLTLLEKLGLEPGEVAHVGDNVIEDVGGPMSVGMKAVLVKRDLKVVATFNLLGVAVVYSLTQLPSVLNLI
uniref:HAD family hydrolase n=1 Tax=Thermogladius calderae TaxID=1200300 RepID=A0A7J3XZU8_9CREN